MPNVLIVSINYWPEQSGIGPYSSGLAEHLASSGHLVTVLTGMPHYPEWEIHDGYRRRSMTESHNGVRIERRRHYVPRRQSALRRAAYEATFFAAALPYATIPRPDAVIGVVPSLSGGMLARLAAARARAGYGVIFQDLMGSAAEQSGIKSGRAVAAAARFLERWVVARATVIAPVTESFVPYLEGMGVPSDRIEVFRNWTHLGPASRERQESRRLLGWASDDWIVLHAGNMGLKQGLGQVVAAAKVAESRGAPVRFVLMGDGNQRQVVEEMAAGTSRLEFRSFVDAAELPNVLAAADVLLLSERESVVDMSLPSKLTSYFAAGRPVLAAVHPKGATAREVERAGAGVVAPAGQPDALLDAVLELRAQPQKVQRLGANGAEYAKAHLDRQQTLAGAEALVARIAQQTAGMRSAEA